MVVGLTFSGLTKLTKSLIYCKGAAASRRVPPRRQDSQGFVEFA